MTPATKESLEQAEIILNRANVALARSQRLIESWLPPKTTEEEPADSQADDDDLQIESETGGIGSTLRKDEDGPFGGSLRRKKIGSNDQLLEQLLGKRAAQAHKKSQQASKASTGRPVSKPLDVPIKRSRPADDSEDEDVGRAGAIKSKKLQPDQRRMNALPNTRPQTDEKDGQVPESLQTPHEKGANRSNNDARPQRKKAMSYLDELLAQKSHKKSKKSAKGDVED